MLSVIVPSYKDRYMPLTVRDLLDRSEGDIEVIVVVDGYVCDLPSKDPRVNVMYLGTNRGMRGAINAGVRVARGEFLMRTDEHCTFGPGYDRILTETCEDNWIVTPRRYYLDPGSWSVMNIPPSDYSRLIINRNPGKFAAVNWPSRAEDRSDIMIDETMGMQGSCWLMKRSWWDAVIGELQTEGYGPHYQDSIEMVFKTWQAGGRLMVNKNTWYAHKHRKFRRTHSYPPDRARQEWAYSLDLWRDYYQKIRRQWYRAASVSTA